MTPLSESRELDDLPETEETEEAVDTDRSSWGHDNIAREGETQGEGEPGRSMGEGEVSSAMVTRQQDGGGRRARWRRNCFDTGVYFRWTLSNGDRGVY